jgi:hypothetical protein
MESEEAQSPHKGVTGWPPGVKRGPRKKPVNPRAEAVVTQRRRRSDSYRGYDLRLDVPEHLKDKDYIYRWINDERGRLAQRTTQDDWDFVTSDELNIASHDDGKNKNEVDGRIRREVTSASSPRPVFSYLCKKRKEYVKADFRAEMQRNIDMRKALIRKQDAGGEGTLASDDAKHSYIPREVKTAIGVTESRIRRVRPRSDEDLADSQR